MLMLRFSFWLSICLSKALILQKFVVVEPIALQVQRNQMKMHKVKAVQAELWCSVSQAWTCDVHHPTILSQSFYSFMLLYSNVVGHSKMVFHSLVQEGSPTR